MFGGDRNTAPQRIQGWVYEAIGGTSVGGTWMAKRRVGCFAQIGVLRSLSGRPSGTGDAGGEFVRRDVEDIAVGWPNPLRIKLLAYE